MSQIFWIALFVLFDEYSCACIVVLSVMNKIARCFLQYFFYQWTLFCCCTAIGNLMLFSFVAYYQAASCAFIPLTLELNIIIRSHERWGWNYAYYFECIFVLPLLITMAFVKDNINGGVLTGAGEYEGTATSLETIEISSLALTEEDTREPLLAQEGSSSPRSKTKKFTIWSEIKTCFSSPLLVTLSFGYAAMIAVVASLGTFGGAFVLALNLFDDERVAAACFGSAAALSGVVGMPLGGRLVDRVLSRYGGKNKELGSMSPGGISGDKIDDSMRHSIVGGILPRINVLVFGSLLFISPTLVMHDAVYFLTFLSIGWILLFATQTGIMLCAMLSVDTGHRPNALAFITLISHLLGDVPAPIILGLIKGEIISLMIDIYDLGYSNGICQLSPHSASTIIADKLAPNCRVGSEGEFVDPVECSNEERGVRLTLAIAYAWTIWSLFFFELARRYAIKEMKKDDAERLAAHTAATSKKAVENSLLLRENEHIGDKGNLDYYHDKFKPPASEETR